MLNRVQNIIRNNKVVFENMTYLSIFQIVTLLFPIITYPYLIRVLGKEIYGIVILSQILVSYVSIVINYGFQVVTVRYIAMYREDKEKVSEIFSSVFFIQLIFSLACLLIYMVIVFAVDTYSSYRILFIVSYGLVLNEILFPQYLFQGLEKMKYITIINVFIRFVSIILIFLFVHSSNDYCYVPLCYVLGYLIAGLYTFYIIIVKEHIKIQKPQKETVLFYLKDATPLFLTNVIGSIKDKWNYFLIGAFVGVGDVAIYDFCMRLMSLLDRPVNIISTALFPKISRERNVKVYKKGLAAITVLITSIVVFVNIFLPYIVSFAVNEEVDLIPIRIFLFIPIILTYSVFCANNLIIGFGYNRKILYSIIITTITYISILGLFYVTNMLDKIVYFILISLVSYLVELVYRFFVSRSIIRREMSK